MLRSETMARVVCGLPQAQISRAWGWLARRRRPRLAIRLLQHAYVRATGCDLSEAAAPLASYPDLESLFVRALRPGARPIDPAADAWASPVDGEVGAAGVLSGGTLMQIKGQPYRAAELLGDEAAAAPFLSGTFVTLYLSPRDYHRIHAPIDAHIDGGAVIPGRLLPVFPAALAASPRLLCRNERVVLRLDTAAGAAVLVAVGATLVGRIRLDFDAGVATNVAGGEPRALAYRPPHRVAKGDLLGAFELGSTVVLLAAPGVMALPPGCRALAAGARVRVGERIATRGVV